jgi:hypothetical protein
MQPEGVMRFRGSTGVMEGDADEEVEMDGSWARDTGTKNAKHATSEEMLFRKRIIDGVGTDAELHSAGPVRLASRARAG